MESPRVSVTRAAYERLNDGDIAGMLELLVPDVEYPDVVHDTVLRGRESVQRHWADLLERADHSARPGEFIEVGEAVIVVVYHQAYEKNGAALGPGVPAVHRVTFEGDLIARVEFSAMEEIPEQVLARLR